jgi:hypothetical protein
MFDDSPVIGVADLPIRAKMPVTGNVVIKSVALKRQNINYHATRSHSLPAVRRCK